jgi:hypothetical protein
MSGRFALVGFAVGAALATLPLGPIHAQELVATAETYGLVCHLVTPTAQRGANIQISGEMAPEPSRGTPCQEPLSGACGMVTGGLVSVTPVSATLGAPRYNAIFAGDARFKAKCAALGIADISPSAGPVAAITAPLALPQYPAGPPDAQLQPPPAASRLQPLRIALPSGESVTTAAPQGAAFSCHFTSGPLAGYTLEPSSSMPLAGPAGVGCTDGYGSGGTVVARGLGCQFTAGPMRGTTVVPVGETLLGPAGAPCDDHYGNYGFQVVAGPAAGS